MLQPATTALLRLPALHAVSLDVQVVRCKRCSVVHNMPGSLRCSKVRCVTALNIMP
jgi:hypothetical protein